MLRFLRPKEGVSSMLQNRVGWTPLHAACFGGAFRVSRLLLSREDVQVNAVDAAGRTPLCEAARKGHLAVAKLVIKAGGSVQHRDKEGKTAVDLCKSKEVRALLTSAAARNEDRRFKTKKGKRMNGDDRGVGSAAAVDGDDEIDEAGAAAQEKQRAKAAARIAREAVLTAAWSARQDGPAAKTSDVTGHEEG